MSIFKNTKNPKDQGSIGEARAVYEYTRMGFVVSKPIKDCDYDLLVDDGNSIKRVQVKTTTHKKSGTTYSCNLRVQGGNQSFATVKKRKMDDWDLLFVLAEDGRCWSIPANEFTAQNALCLNERFDGFLLREH